MDPRQYYEAVVRPNAEMLFESGSDLRHAINAILTIDALMGQLYHWLEIQGRAVAPSDHVFRDQLGALYDKYALLRDTAFALKHGRLTGRKARLVSSSEQVASRAITLGDGFFLGHDFLGGAAVFVEHDDGKSSRAEFLVAEVVRFCDRQLSQYGLPASGSDERPLA